MKTTHQAVKVDWNGERLDGVVLPVLAVVRLNSGKRFVSDLESIYFSFILKYYFNI